MLVAQSCPTLCDSMDCIPPGSSVLGILQARMLEWVAIPFSRGIFLTQGLNPGLLHCRRILYHLSHQGSPGGVLTLTSSVSFSPPVIGALIGKQEGRNIEVMNSFELLSHTVEEKIIIDKEYYYTKEEQCERGIDLGEKSGSGGERMGKMERAGEKINREMGPE